MSIDFPVRNRVPAVSGLSNGVFAVMVMLAPRHVMPWPLRPKRGRPAHLPINGRATAGFRLRPACFRLSGAHRLERAALRYVSLK